MIELNINNLTKFYGANKIFENISLEIKTGERIGLIGQNGCGKSTIMKILMGLEDYQSGEISLRKDNKVGYLNQIPVYEAETTTMEVIRMAFQSIYELRKQMDELEFQMGHLEGNLLERAVSQYSKVLEQYELGGGYELEIKINKVTEGLQITDNLKEMLFDQLSGGEKTRVILAKILLEEPDILLLDEPTNHLDLVTIDWLEGFLKEYQGAALIISHDRYFLDSVVGKIIELEFDHAEVYLGNYSYFVVEKERRFLIEFKNYQNQQKKIDRMEHQIERYRIWGVMRDSEVMFKRAKELEKRLEKIDVMKRPVLDKRKIRLNNNAIGRSGKMVLEIKNLNKCFGERIILSDVNMNIFYQDSACIIGENGSGKTTILKMILGALEPDQGIIRIGSQVSIGYLPQHVEYLDEDQTMLEYFANLHNLSFGAARSLLAKVLFFNEDVNKKIRFLSGGEKSRLKLCSLTFEGVNLLILDEPTNHLDVDSREVLEETLSEFEGTLLFVSHDRYFINKLADKIITIENKTTKQYDGDYSYYQEEYKKEQERRTTLTLQDKYGKSTENSTKDTKSINHHLLTSENPKNSITKNKPSRKLEMLEKSIEELEEKIKSLEEMMNKHNSDGNRLKELYEEKEQVERQLETSYSEWEALQY
ncbi:MAG: abc-f [Herbinix sp.]|jgi:ATPase subunit of ABC transporter with duplicated ATPase domains|nr:abc-f [Herbinix sp.]